MTKADEGAVEVIQRLEPGTVAALRWVAVLWALATLALAVVGRRFGVFTARPGALSFELIVQPAWAGILLLGLIVALRFQIAGAAIAAFAASGLLVFAAEQLRDRDVALVAIAFVVPALLWLILDIHDETPRRALLGIGVVAALAVGGNLSARWGYDFVFGPTHPDSAVEVLDDSFVDWAWSGAVNTTGAEVVVKVADAEAEPVLLSVSTVADFGESRMIEGERRVDGIHAFVIEDLQPDRRYYYAVVIDGERDENRTGEFRTYPEGPSSYTIVAGGCARTGSNGAVFDVIAEIDPLQYLIVGDLHYGDIGLDDFGEFRRVMDLTLEQPAQSVLYRKTSMAYVWDDHDFGSNDAGGSSLSRAAASRSYRAHVPSYPLADDDASVYQAYTIGRVRYILTDARSSRDDVDRPDDKNKSMLGQQQKEWLLAEFAAAVDEYPVVVWVNPVPWIDDSVGSDRWGGYTTERREIANEIDRLGLTDQLIMLSGDSHMVAIDDGTNSGYADAGGPGFPVLHVAALDRKGSVKGGPYSEGVFPGGGQFTTLDFADDGSTITVTMEGIDWQGEVFVSFEARFSG